jgi:hypothetical protein
MTCRGRLIFSIGLGLLLLPIAGAAASDAAVPVSVESAGGVLTVKVTSTTPLRLVLEAVCERAQASCKLPKDMPDVPVKPRTIAGAWVDVVTELLQGSELSFGATPPAAGRVAYLVVEPRAAVRASATHEMGKPALALPPQAIVEEEPLEEVPAEFEANTTPIDPADATLVTAATAAATRDAPFAMTPFSDAQGNPLLSRLSTPPGAPPPGVAVLPYSDEAGNPLTSQITNEPPSLTPFAGPDGQPWPAPVQIPNQKLEYPIPPTDPSPPKPENQ